MSTTITGVSQQTTEHVMLQPSEAMPQPRVEVCVVQQHSIMEVNLKGKALVAAVLFLILTNLLFHQFWSCIIVALLPIPFLIYNDYMNFLSLGPGGTPSTFAGYLKITYLRFFALSDPYTPVTFAERLNPPQGYYKGSPSWLPKRSGPRPTIAGIAPHRQVDQPGCPEMYQKLRSSLELLAKKDSEHFRTDISCFEKKGLALFANNPINATCRGEICHVHHLEHSLHMNLHPEDAKLVLENGWGERHPLAKGGWLSQYVPREFVMVYAPRDQTELEFVARIIEAAGFWVSGVRISLGTTEDDNV